jgi:uncharacterized protein (DUF885 family)
LRTVLLAAVLSTACGYDPAADRFVQLRDRFFVRHLLFNPVTATYLGADGYSDVLHATNGALKDYSEATLSRELAFYRETQKELTAMSATGLPPSLQVDYHVMDAQLKYLTRLIDDRRYHQRALDTYVAEPFRGIDWQIQQMQDLGGNNRGSEDEWKLVATRLDGIPRYLDAARANIAAGRKSGNVPDCRMIERDGINGSAGNAKYFRHTLPESAAGYISNRTFAGSVVPKLREAGEKAAVAYDAFAGFLRSTFGAGLEPCPDRFAVGADEYEWRVRNVLRDGRSAAELYEYGAQQVALYASRLQNMSAVMARDAGLGNASLRDVVSHLAKD